MTVHGTWVVAGVSFSSGVWFSFSDALNAGGLMEVTIGGNGSPKLVER